MIPSPFPIYDYSNLTLSDGSTLNVCTQCKKEKANDPCKKHYESLLNKVAGYYQCPSGFTTRTFYCMGQLYAITGVIAFPRFNTTNERKTAKANQSHKTSRNYIDKYIALLKEVDDFRADAIETASNVLPQAFHELRKLNGSIIQHAEKEMKTHSSPALITIKSAAELMRNNFDMLEALSNIDLVKGMPLDTTICLLDLSYKMKKVYEERAKIKKLTVTVDGVRAIIPGSKKSFPIVPAVLIENAIKYSSYGTEILVHIVTKNHMACLTVKNESPHPIDPDACFDRGSRFAANVAEGGGFGLYLAREVVLAHNGTIDCEKVGSVVTMTVLLPLEKVIS